jgi:hypothetical protein
MILRCSSVRSSSALCFRFRFRPLVAIPDADPEGEDQQEDSYDDPSDFPTVQPVTQRAQPLATGFESRTADFGN